MGGQTPEAFGSAFRLQQPWSRAKAPIRWEKYPLGLFTSCGGSFFGWFSRLGNTKTHCFLGEHQNALFPFGVPSIPSNKRGSKSHFEKPHGFHSTAKITTCSLTKLTFGFNLCSFPFGPSSSFCDHGEAIQGLRLQVRARGMPAAFG